MTYLFSKKLRRKKISQILIDLIFPKNVDTYLQRFRSQGFLRINVVRNQ